MADKNEKGFIEGAPDYEEVEVSDMLTAMNEQDYKVSVTAYAHYKFEVLAHLRDQQAATSRIASGIFRGYQAGKYTTEEYGTRVQNCEAELAAIEKLIQQIINL